jgi:hypothetical protein
MGQNPTERTPPALWRVAVGLAMAATLLVDGVLLWAILSYAATGRPLTASDWVISAGLTAAMLGALLVLLRLIQGHRPGWLGLPVVVMGLVLPILIAIAFAVSGPPFVY